MSEKELKEEITREEKQLEQMRQRLAREKERRALEREARRLRAPSWAINETPITGDDALLASAVTQAFARGELVWKD